jgi:hypothetical protein
MRTILRKTNGCLLAALLLASPVVVAEQHDTPTLIAQEDGDRYGDRGRDSDREDRYGDRGRGSDGDDRHDDRDCSRDRDDRYRGRDCDNYWTNDRYDSPSYVGQPTRRHPGGTTDRYGTPEYIGQPNRGSAYDGVGSGHREIDRGRASSRQIQRGGGGGRR